MTRRAQVDEAVQAALAGTLHPGEAIRSTFFGRTRVRLALVLPPLCAWGLWLSVQGRDRDLWLLTAAVVGAMYVCTRKYIFAVTDRRALVVASGRGLRSRAGFCYELTNGIRDIKLRTRWGRTFVSLELDGPEVTVELAHGEAKRARAAIDGAETPTPERVPVVAG